MISATRRSVSAGDAFGSTRGRIRKGLRAASGGKSHSCVTPTTQSPRPSAYRISVAEGSSEQIRIGLTAAAVLMRIPARLRRPPKPPAEDRRRRTNRAQRSRPPPLEFFRETSALHSQTCGTLRFPRKDRRRAEDQSSRLASKRRPAKLRSSFRGSTQVRYAESPPASMSCASLRVSIPHTGNTGVMPQSASCFSR